jgi:hypothetical protein
VGTRGDELVNHMRKSCSRHRTRSILIPAPKRDVVDVVSVSVVQAVIVIARGADFDVRGPASVYISVTRRRSRSLCFRACIAITERSRRSAITTSDRSPRKITLSSSDVYGRPPVPTAEPVWRRHGARAGCRA